MKAVSFDMRRMLLVALLLLCCGSSRTAAQLPPPTAMQGVQELVNAKAEETAEELAMLAKRNATGFLNPTAEMAFRRLDEAVRLWKKENALGAGPLLAEGVLFDCLGRLNGVKTQPLPSEGPQHKLFTDVAKGRRDRAVKVLRDALKIDTGLIEARMRIARIRASEDSDAVHELESIAEENDRSPFAYVAAMSLAELALQKDDSRTAITWYELALRINPESVSASIGLSLLAPEINLSVEDLAGTDLYYTYPCTILTANVGVAFADRVRRVVAK